MTLQGEMRALEVYNLGSGPEAVTSLNGGVAVVYIRICREDTEGRFVLGEYQ